jgi:hypothetical protein
MEIWKPVTEISIRGKEPFKPHGYEVSNLGRVRSYKNKYGQGKRALLAVSTIVNGRLDQVGYVQYCMSDINGVRKNVRGHVLVAETFFGKRPEGMIICHEDDVKTNNKLSNLSFGTYKTNSQDRFRNAKKRIKK